MIRFSKGLIVKPYTWVFYGSLQGKQAGYYKNSRGNYFWAAAKIGINRFCSTFHIHAHAPHHDQPLLIPEPPQAIGRYR
jgi:hypothetical protein